MNGRIEGIENLGVCINTGFLKAVLGPECIKKELQHTVCSTHFFMMVRTLGTA